VGPGDKTVFEAGVPLSTGRMSINFISARWSEVFAALMALSGEVRGTEDLRAGERNPIPCGHSVVSATTVLDRSESADPPFGSVGSPFSADAGPTSDFGSCTTSCLAAADRQWHVCFADAEDAMKCAGEGRSELLSCLRERCSDDHADKACDISCHWHAERVLRFCRDPSDDGNICADRSRQAYGECLKSQCGETPPAPSCESQCRFRGQEIFSGCVHDGGTPETCSTLSRESVNRCLAESCLVDPPPSACEVRCDELSNREHGECLDAGGTSAFCMRGANESRLRCLENECGIAAPCVTACVRKRVFDTRGDAVWRPTTPPPNPGEEERGRLIDLLDITLGTWQPLRPGIDLFEGQFGPDGHFLRLDIRLAGLVNPPGSLDPNSFQPFEYGPRPLYGFVEIDLDGNVNTGGEVVHPQYRYLSNVARFGGLPSVPAHRDRAARHDAALDGRFGSPPFVERHGEEFHLALLGGEFGTIVKRRGDDDDRFELQEIWLLRGPFFHRAHGFEPFSLAEGGRVPGEYSPDCDLLFRHEPKEDVTLVSLVFPLTNFGAGLVLGRPAEPLNANPRDQASILEGLEDLQRSAEFLGVFPSGLAEQILIDGWAQQKPGMFLRPSAWSFSANVGTAGNLIDRSYWPFAWTDVYPNALVGDVDGNATRTEEDAAAIRRETASLDGRDGVLDGKARILGFPKNFSVFDTNYDGAVESSDIVYVDGDSDGDGDVDLHDFAVFQLCFGGAGISSPCIEFDLTSDPAINAADMPPFAWLLTGPRRK